MSLDYAYEAGLGRMRIAGVDEVGRGPWAGPVVAAAVVLDPAALPDGLNDSKRIAPRKRERIYDEIVATADIGIGVASVAEIDKLNILVASHLAMARAVVALPRIPDHALIDGNRVPDGLTCPATPLVKGDARIASIAAASIVAKVTRDRMMAELARKFPGYGWDHNMGYGTEEHRVSLFCNGVTPHHRRSFRPIHNMLMENDAVKD